MLGFLKELTFLLKKCTKLTASGLWSGIEINAEGFITMQTGHLDRQIGFRQLDAGGDPLIALSLDVPQFLQQMIDTWVNTL
jgi:hypothetical protein